MDNVVIVELPAKAKTINKYLGKDYTVLASYGHVRDLLEKDGSVRPDEQFAMSWAVEDRAEKRIKDIARAVKGAKHLYLATDPDREGEAISWHIDEILRQRTRLKGVDVKRVVFHEITKEAVQEAFRHPREVNQELVDAYLARRALDYLVGFTLSPVLWRKLPGSRSAGRVQSVALRLICEREDEIEAFKSREYWTIEVEFETAKGERFTARLTHLDGKRLDKFDLDNEAKARDAADRIARAASFAVASVEKKQVRRHPGPPFTTSTLQQEASRKLGFGASRTMRVAQRLYEDGLHHLYAHRWRYAGDEADRGSTAPDRRRFRQRISAGEAAPLYHAAPRMPRKRTRRSARPIVPSPERGARARRRRAQPLRADLEAHHRLPNGSGGDRPGNGRHRIPPTRRCACAPPARRFCSTVSSSSIAKMSTIRARKRKVVACRCWPNATRSIAAKSHPTQHFTEPPPRY